MRSLMIIALSLVACTTAPPADGSAVQAIVTPLFPTPPLVTVGPAAAIAASTTASFNGWGWNVSAVSAAVRYPVALPRGAKLTGWQLYLQRAIAAAPTSARLQCQDATGTHSDVGPVVQRLDGATGATSLDAVFSATVDPACVSYSLLVTGSAGCGDTTTGLVVYGDARHSTTVAGLSGVSASRDSAWTVPTASISTTASTSLLFSVPVTDGSAADQVDVVVSGDGAVGATASAWLSRPGSSSLIGAPVQRSAIAGQQTITMPLGGTPIAEGDSILLQVFSTAAGLTVHTVTVAFR